MSELLRPARVDVDLGIIRNNVEILRRTVAPAEVCAAVKADGYGHGAVQVAQAAIDGGATRLAVALVEEGKTLREAGIDAPILVLSEPHPDAMSAVVDARLTPTLYSQIGLEAIADVAIGEYPVHVKVDTGMNRVGVRRDQAVEFLELVRQHDNLMLEGVFTHFAVADEPNNNFTNVQGERFVQILKDATDLGIAPPLVHAANSAGGLLYPDFRFSFVRFGIALYGLTPTAPSDVALPEGVRPALSMNAQVSMSKLVDAGEAIGYGQNYRLEKRSRIATVPVGYADGVFRSLGSTGGEVLIGGKRRRIAGNVSMDQITIDCGDDDITAGDEVVLIGQQGDERITAEEWAQRVGTIPYEITCRIGPRLPRNYDLR